MLLIKLKANDVVFRIGKVREAIDYAHHKQDCGVDPDGHAGLALFNLDQGCPADGGALRRDGHGNTSPPPGVADIVAELA